MPRPPHYPLLTLAALTVLSLFIIQFWILSYNYIHYPYEIDYGEGCSLTFLTHLKTYGTYFFDINDYPFSYATYPPVFFFFAWVFNLFVPSPLMASRLVSISATFFIVPILYFFILNRTKHRALAALFALSFLSVWFVRFWAPLARIDILVNLFTITGLFFFQIYFENNKRYLAFLFFALAFFTKQNAILAPLSIFLFTLIKKDQRKNFIPYLGAYLIPILFLFMSLNIYTRGEALKHLFLYTSQREFYPLAFCHGTIHLLAALFFLLPFASPFRFIKKIWGSENLIYWLYGVLNLIFLPSVAFTGANLNYFIEPLMSFIILGAIVCHYWVQNAPSPEKNKSRYFIVLSLLFFHGIWSFLLGHYVVEFQMYDFARRLNDRNNDFNRAIYEEIKATPGDVICENQTALAENNKPILFGCSYPLAERGLWYPEHLVQDCYEKRFNSIITEWRIINIVQIHACLRSQYHPKKQFWEKGIIFVPRKKTALF